MCNKLRSIHRTLRYAMRAVVACRGGNAGPPPPVGACYSSLAHRVTPGSREAALNSCPAASKNMIIEVFSAATGRTATLLQRNKASLHCPASQALPGPPGATRSWLTSVNSVRARRILHSTLVLHNCTLVPRLCASPAPSLRTPLPALPLVSKSGPLAALTNGSSVLH